MRLRRPSPEPEVLGPGVLALDAHIDAADGGPARHRWYPRAAHARRDQGPLDSVTGHLIGDHWHLVTYGLSEIDGKASDDPDVSGWGFELSIRVEVDDDAGPSPAGAKRGGEDQPGPAWAVDLLANLATYLWTSRHPFAAGHHVALGGPIRLRADTVLTAAAVVADPGLSDLDGPFGHVEFLQVVALSSDELEWCRSWTTDGIVGLLAERDPMLVTRIGRCSILDDPAVRAEVERRAAEDGASLTELRVGTLECERRRGRGAVVRMGAGAAAALGPALRRELIAEGASFEVVGDDARIRFKVGEAGWSEKAAGIDTAVTIEGTAELASLFDGKTGWGRHSELSGLRFQVIP